MEQWNLEYNFTKFQQMEQKQELKKILKSPNCKI